MNIKQIENINSLKVFSKTIFCCNTNLRGTTLIGFELVKFYKFYLCITSITENLLCFQLLKLHSPAWILYFSFKICWFNRIVTYPGSLNLEQECIIIFFQLQYISSNLINGATQWYVLNTDKVCF